MEKELYLFIQNRMPAQVQHFNWFNNQFETQEEEEPFEAPAVFVEVLPYTTTSLGTKRIAAEVNFNLHIGQQLHTGMGKGRKRQTHAINHLQLCSQILAALHGSNNQGTIGTIKSTAVSPSHNFGAYIVHVYSFSCRCYTNVAVKPTIALPPNTPLEVEA